MYRCVTEHSLNRIFDVECLYIGADHLKHKRTGAFLLVHFFLVHTHIPNETFVLRFAHIKDVWLLTTFVCVLAFMA